MNEKSDYIFTKNWFTDVKSPNVWTKFIPLLLPNPKVLEIGSFEGKSAVWIIDNLLGDKGNLVCIDAWKGSEEHKNEDMKAVEHRFDHNIALAIKNKLWKEENEICPQSVIKIKNTSVKGMFLIAPKCYEYFDFIYIDGDHNASSIITDACIAWNLLKPNGILVFDDYEWTCNELLCRPALAIDAFCNLFFKDIEILHKGWQVIIKKKS